MQAVSQLLGEDFVVIPQAVSKVIIHPLSYMSEVKARRMVKDITISNPTISAERRFRQGLIGIAVRGIGWRC
jgi:hypothetical protein